MRWVSTQRASRRRRANRNELHWVWGEGLDRFDLAFDMHRSLDNGLDWRKAFHGKLPNSWDIWDFYWSVESTKSVRNLRDTKHYVGTFGRPFGRLDKMALGISLSLACFFIAVELIRLGSLEKCSTPMPIISTTQILDWLMIAGKLEKVGH